jgi:peroxiredoxin
MKERDAITLGDPVPWFSGSSITGAPLSLHVDAGRWVVLSFIGSLADPGAAQELARLLAQAHLFAEPHIVVYAVLTAPPPEAALAVLAKASGPALLFIADYDRAITRRYGAEAMRRTIVLDPMLRAIANVAWDHPDGHAEMVQRLLFELPPPSESAGTELSAPALIVPRVFDFPLCDLLVALYDTMGGTESGFMLDQGGKSGTVIDHRLKRRQDLAIVDPALRETIRAQIVRRLVPPIARFFQFEATRMERYLVSCYDSATGGHFFRHRDDINAGARHRRFAVSINLSDRHEGCDLVFPEFGAAHYRPPVGGAVVFSCGMLHEVTPITAGRRFAFLPFLYGEADVALREANNANLAAGESRYARDTDLLLCPARADAA